jgi:hypothetical protein
MLAEAGVQMVLAILVVLIGQHCVLGQFMGRHVAEQSLEPLKIHKYGYIPVLNHRGKYCREWGPDPDVDGVCGNGQKGSCQVRGTKIARVR